jgi:hypothetical protein
MLAGGKAAEAAVYRLPLTTIQDIQTPGQRLLKMLEAIVIRSTFRKKPAETRAPGIRTT